LAASLLGACHSRWRWSWTSRRLHSFQSGEARICHTCRRLAAQQFPSLCRARVASCWLGWWFEGYCWFIRRV